MSQVGGAKPDNGAQCHSCLTIGTRQHGDCSLSPVYCTEQMRALYIDNESNLISSSGSDNSSPPNTPETNGKFWYFLSNSVNSMHLCLLLSELQADHWNLMEKALDKGNKKLMELSYCFESGGRLILRVN